MSELSLKHDDNLLEILEKLKKVKEREVLISFSPDSPLLENKLNLKILKKEGERLGKKVIFRGGGLLEEGDFGFVQGKDILEVGGQPPLSGMFRLKLTPRSVGGIGIFILFAGILFSIYYFLPKATISLVVSSEALVKSLELTASPSAEVVDEEARVVPAVKIEVLEKGQKEGQAGGKKEVGEKAQGRVTIYNKTDSGKTFVKGTAISKGQIEGEDLLFLLDNEINVPAREATDTPRPGYIFGTAETSVTAEKIGDEGNLPPETTFNVASFPTSQYIASSKEVFSGGSKREVKIVTAEDRQKLLGELKEELEEKAKADLGSKTVGDQRLEKGAIETLVQKESFDKEVEEEAEKFSLNLEIKSIGLVFSESDLSRLLRELLREFVPDQYELSSEDQETEVFGAKVEEGVLRFTAKVRGFVVPKISKERLKSDLSGRPLSAARAYLSSLPNIDSYNINLWPPLPSPLQTLPHLKERIAVEVIRR